MATTASPKTLTCLWCHTSKEITGKRLPHGWKRYRDGHACGECWEQRFLLRTISVPVVSPVSCTWEELRASLKLMWAQTTQCSNWMMTGCYVRDVVDRSKEKMSGMPYLYLYPEARSLFPDLPPQSVAAIEQAVQRKYRALRYKVKWTRQISLPSFRYPTPYPVPVQSWNPSAGTDGEPLVTIRVADVHHTLRLKGGAQFHRQHAAFAKLTSGDAIYGELAIYQKGDALMVKIAAWLPRTRERTYTLSGTLHVATGDDMLLSAHVNGDLWRYHGNQLRRWAAEHRKRLQCWSDDSKFEHRPVPAFAERRADAATKYHNRMHSACHEISRCIAGYAERRQVAVVEYDDRARGWCPEFPYAELKRLLAEKLNESGIRISSPEPPDKGSGV
jgi:hypothetical protein